jgi:hypothetical protein
MTRAALEVAAKVGKVLLLSGTPSLTRPFTIFNQVSSKPYTLHPKP